jgi:hypothetical protein
MKDHDHRGSISDRGARLPRAAAHAEPCWRRESDTGHGQEQEEVYFIVEGTGEMCLGEERQTVTTGQAVYIPSGVFHQLTNIGDTPLRMIYIYGPAGDVAHWRQELSGTLPKAGIDVPALPEGARPQTA